MREIKFRVWSTKPGQLPPKMMVELDPRGKRFVGIDLIDSDDWHVMQFTGIRDRNNTDVYEGDIVKYNTGETWIVEWSHMYFKDILKDNRRGYNLTQNLGAHEVEIIGNIWENPELIKSTKWAL